MVRNAAIALLVIISAALAYGYYQTAKEADRQGQLLIESQQKSEKDLQALRDKLANEERARQTAEKDAKAVSAKLAEEQAARDAAEQSAKTSNERVAQIQNALANSEQSARDARDALEKAQKEKAGAEQAAKEGLDPLLEAKVREWIKQKWPFQKVIYPGRDMPMPAWNALKDATD